jgi:uncharacterized membrane protein
VASVDKMSIVLIAVLSWWIFGEEMSPLAMAAIGLITAGTVLLVFA